MGDAKPTRDDVALWMTSSLGAQWYALDDRQQAQMLDEAWSATGDSRDTALRIARVLTERLSA